MDSRLLPPGDAGLLWLAFSAEALLPQGTLKTLLDESGRFAGTLAVNLRERIYGQVMPGLATAIARARSGRILSPEKLAETYEMAVTVLFRLLFISYAEDKDLLPYKADERYRAASLKRLAAGITAMGFASGGKKICLFRQSPFRRNARAPRAPAPQAGPYCRAFAT